jgi:hypothetical protein
MPKWKENAKEFTVSVNYHPKRGYQSCIPKPVIERLGKRDLDIMIYKNKSQLFWFRVIL